MAHAHLKIRAVIFDVYGTLLDVGEPPADAVEQWQKLFQEVAGISPPLDRIEFSARTSQVIALRHAEARARAIQWPEIVWPSVVLEVLPELSRLSAEQLDEFLFRQMQIGRSLRFAEDAPACLRRMSERQLLLGLASNSQAYTLRELETALGGSGLSLSLFDPALRFWSFENGFSKPDPHVFRILATRLEKRGVQPSETLMVGDRLDNDIEPAHVHGWQTWLFTAGKPAEAQPGGNWKDLRAWFG